MPSRRTGRAAALAATALLLTACSSSGGGHHEDPLLIPAGASGAAALGQPLSRMADVERWVQSKTDECDTVTPADREDLAEYLGPVRYPWYEPFVAEWATCAVRPYDKIGLVLFAPDAQRGLQQAWRHALATGEERGNPDWAFGNGFAVTAGPLGAQELGLRYLVCTPGAQSPEETVPSDVDGCVFVADSHHAE